MKRKYSIPIVWESYKRVDVEADSLQDAIVKALKQFLSEPDETYIQDSFVIDEIVYDENPDEDFNIGEVYEKL